MVLLGRLGRLSLATSSKNRHELAISTVRGKATAVSPETKAVVEDDLEWEKAKPYDSIPGYRKLPVIGTMWSMFPVIGNFCCL